jgi:hypothetical protein
MFENAFNQHTLSHFRARPGAVQQDGVKAAMDWLATGPPLVSPPEVVRVEPAPAARPAAQDPIEQ